MSNPSFGQPVEERPAAETTREADVTPARDRERMGNADKGYVADGVLLEQLEQPFKARVKAVHKALEHAEPGFVGFAGHLFALGGGRR